MRILSVTREKLIQIPSVSLQEKDCKGKEIFEHDLIHFVGYKPTAEVFWSEDDYAFMAASENEPLYLLSDVLEIGKIERVCNKFDKEK